MGDTSTRYSSSENQESVEARRDALDAIFGPRRVTLKRPKTALEKIAARAKGQNYKLTMTSDTAISDMGAVLPIPQAVIEKHQRHERRRTVLTEALDVLTSVAAQDADGARRQNGVGFNKADSSAGHRLSRIPVDRLMRDRTTAEQVLKLAARYRGQASALRQIDLFG